MGQANRGPLTARIWLTFVVFCQIFLTPMAAFSITYLLDLNMTGENITIGIQREMLPWIMAASLGYGMHLHCSSLWSWEDIVRFELLNVEDGWRH